MTNTKSLILLLFTTIIWGSAFVAQSTGMNYVGPFTFNACRFFLGGLSLIPFIFLSNKNNQENKKKDKKDLWKGGILCGTALALASLTQQVGIQYTTVGKAGFLTSLYIIIVPLLSLFLKEKVSKNVWKSLPLALIGTLLLCETKNLSMQKGDLLCILCAFLFSVHIILIGKFSPKVSALKLSCIQFFVASALSSVLMITFETPDFSSIIQGWLPICYAGILSCGVAYTFQAIAQKNIEPSVAGIVMSLESVFALISGWLILKQHLLPLELVGCLMVFSAVILAQRKNTNH